MHAPAVNRGGEKCTGQLRCRSPTAEDEDEEAERMHSTTEVLFAEDEDEDEEPAPGSTWQRTPVTNLAVVVAFAIVMTTSTAA